MTISARHGALGTLFAALALAFGLIFAGPAAAHSGVVSSAPADGASLATSPGEVSLTFNEELRAAFAELKVVGPDGAFWQQGEPTVAGRTISVKVGELGPVGEYKVNYRVTSADGHPVQGQNTFTLTVAGAGAASAGAQPSTPAAAPAAAESNGVSGWIVALIVLLVLVVFAGIYALLRRRNK